MELRESVLQHSYLAQARRAIQLGDARFQDACVLARGHACDIETEAIGMARRGRVYAKVLRNESLARPLLKEAVTLVASLAPRSFHGVKWYDDCIRQLQSCQEATAQADERMENRRR